MNKKYSFMIIFFLFFLINFLTTNAQFRNKGTVELGGSISYSSMTTVTNGTTDNNSTSIFNFTPMVSYFIAEGFYLGVSPGINIVKVAGSNDAITNLMLFAVPGYAFGKGEVFPFVEGWVGYTAVSSNSDPILGSGKLDLSGVSYGGRGGVKIQVGKGGLVNIGVSYTALTLNPKGADKRTGMNVLGVVVGFSVFIGR